MTDTNPCTTLREALAEYLAEQDEDNWCQRLKYGQCSTRKCLIDADGKPPAVPFSYDLASCPRYRVELALAQAPQSTQAPAAELVAALAEYDATNALCPFTKRKAPPSSKPCPLCSATAKDTCVKQTVAGVQLARAIRAAVARHNAPLPAPEPARRYELNAEEGRFNYGPWVIIGATWVRPGPGVDWDFRHEDYDGPGDHRCGSAASVEACIAEIHAWEDEQ